MNISRDDAAQALSDIARTEGRSRDLLGYRVAGPILMVWGVIWMICYAAMGILKPAQWGMVWIPADIVGITASIIMGYRARCRPATAMSWWRILGFGLLIATFSAAVFSMFYPAGMNAYMAFPGLLTGTIYASIGLVRMTRFLWVGLVVIAFTLTGYFLFPTYLAYWMAVTGGGGLIISGILLRRA